MRKRYLIGSCFLVICLMTAVIFGGDAIPLWAMTVFLLLIPISLLGGLFFAPQLTGTVTVPTVTEAGKENILTVSVANHGIFPFFCLGTELRVQNRFTGEFSDFSKPLFVPSKGNHCYQVQLCADHIGRLDVKLEKLSIYDCFGFLHFHRNMQASAPITVLPALFIPEVILTKNGSAEPECDTFSPYKSGNDPSETFGIREYEPGDALSRIHWKLTGKYDAPVIREASLPMNESVLILVELSVSQGQAEPSPAVRHSIGEIALSLSHRLLDMGFGHTLIWQNGNTGGLTEFGINHEETFPEMADALLSSAPVIGNENTVIAYQKAHAQCSYSNIVYISPFFSEYLGLLTLAGRKTQIICNEQEQQGNCDTFCYYTTPERYEIDLSEILI